MAGLKPDTRNLNTETLIFIQDIVRKNSIRAYHYIEQTLLFPQIIESAPNIRIKSIVHYQIAFEHHNV